MPFKSKAQRRWMYANEPAMADRWEKHTPKSKKLPERKTEKMAGIAESILLKIAMKNEKRVKPHSAGGEPALKGFAGGILANLGLGAGALLSTKGFIDQGNAVDTDTLLKKLKMQEPSAGLPRHAVPREAQSAYLPKVPNYLKKIIGEMEPEAKELLKTEKLLLPNKANPFVTAHEVGHASGGKFRKALLRHKLPITLGTGLASLGLLGHAAYTGEKGEGMGATGYAAPAVAAVAPVMSQIEELAATLKAKKLLGKAKVKVPNLGRMMGTQQLNYLLTNLGAVAPVGLGAYALHRYLKPKDEKVQQNV